MITNVNEFVCFHNRFLIKNVLIFFERLINEYRLTPLEQKFSWSCSLSMSRSTLSSWSSQSTWVDPTRRKSLQRQSNLRGASSLTVWSALARFHNRTRSRAWSYQTLQQLHCVISLSNNLRQICRNASTTAYICVWGTAGYSEFGLRMPRAPLENRR